MLLFFGVFVPEISFLQLQLQNLNAILKIMFHPVANKLKHYFFDGLQRVQFSY